MILLVGQSGKIWVVTALHAPPRLGREIGHLQQLRLGFPDLIGSCFLAGGNGCVGTPPVPTIFPPELKLSCSLHLSCVILRSLVLYVWFRASDC